MATAKGWDCLGWVWVGSGRDAGWKGGKVERWKGGRFAHFTIAGNGQNPFIGDAIGIADVGTKAGDQDVGPNM